MESGEAYSIKGDQCMKEAYKKLKGTSQSIQDLSSATSSATKANVQKKPSSFLSRQPPTINLRSAGTTRRRLISNASSATRCARGARPQTTTRKQPT